MNLKIFAKKKKADSFSGATLPRIGGTRGKLGLPETIPGQPYTEHIRELIPPYGLLRFKKMRHDEPIIGGVMLEIESLFSGLNYVIEGENADFIEDILQSMKNPVNQIIYEMASALTYGFYVGEEVYKYIDGNVVLIDIEPRYQPTIKAIDSESGVVLQETDSGSYEIPLNKVTHHTFMSDCRNPFGISILRHVYKPYYFKIAIESSEASSIDRDLSGIPKITAPQGFDFTAADQNSQNYDPSVEATLQWATDIVTGVRNDTYQGIVLPFGWTLDIIRGENRTTIPTSEIINRYNTEMVTGLLSQFLFTAKMTDAKTQITTFMDAVDALASKVALTFNRLIEKICRLNGLNEAPKMRFIKLRKDDLVALGSFVARLAANGVITPTEELESQLLHIANLPVGKTPKETPDANS